MHPVRDVLILTRSFESRVVPQAKFFAAVEQNGLRNPYIAACIALPAAGGIMQEQDGDNVKRMKTRKPQLD